MTEFVGAEWLKCVLDRRSGVVDKLPEDGSLMSKHVAVGTSHELCAVMCRITTFRPTTDLIYYGCPIILQYYNTILQYYNTPRCVTIAYSIQYSNTLYRFVA